MIHYIVCNSLNRVPFGKCKQVRVPTSFICTEWHFINSFRSSSKCFFVTSLSTDSCTKRKTSSLQHFLLVYFYWYIFIVIFLLLCFLLLCFRVCIEATIKVSKPRFQTSRFNDMRNVFYIGNFYNIGNIVTTLLYYFYNNNYLWWSLFVLLNKINRVFDS